MTDQEDIEVLKPDKIYINLDDSIINDICDRYISTLKDPDIIYNIRGNAFTGLIKKLHKELNITSKVYEDINILNDLWELYTELCYRYNQNPNVMEYCLLIGCNRDTFYSWQSGEYRQDICKALNLSRSDTLRKWNDECRQGRYKLAAAGNVGGIFLCKAVDGMAETAPIQIDANQQHKTAEQIARERGLELHENATQLPPPKPPSD